MTSVAGQAAPPQKETFKFKGMGTSAFLSEADECLNTRLDVTAFDRVQRTNGSQTTERLIYVSFNATDICTGAFVLGGVDSMPAAEFDASMKAASLRLSFPVQISDGTGGPAEDGTASLVVNWTPTGDSFKSASQTLSRMGNTVVRSRFDGTTATANAAATVTVGSQQFTLDGPGDISNNTSGSITIVR